MKERWLTNFLILFLSLFFLTSCSGKSEKIQESDLTQTEKLLRVGVTTNYPPLAFKENGRFAGVEIDFAKLLAKELERPVRAFNIPWEKQIPYLLSGKIDLIMSGMTITAEREVRIAFTEPYMVTGLVAAIRNSDREEFKSVEDCLKEKIPVGVIRGSVGERYVRQNFLAASRIVLFDNAEEAALALIQNNITLFVDDAPAVMWTVSRFESEICGLWEPFHKEKLAWGVRKGDVELRKSLNTVVDKWLKDGTVESVLEKWLPYRLEM